MEKSYMVTRASAHLRILLIEVPVWPTTEEKPNNPHAPRVALVRSLILSSDSVVNTMLIRR